jgi:hypothetical protein
MTDISANIFALLILILILILAAREHSPAPRAEAPQVVDVESDIASIERSTLSSGDLFDLLYERREGAPTTKIDLFGHGIDVISGGKTEHFSSVENAVTRLRQIAAASTRLPVGVYVFSHQSYRNVTDNLKALGLNWREVSVPQALRDARLQTRGQGWSNGFSELIARPSNRAEFRVELARLLQSSTDEPPGRSSHEGGASGQRPENIIANLVRWSRAALDMISIFGGFIFVGWVEMCRTRNARSN